MASFTQRSNSLPCALVCMVERVLLCSLWGYFQNTYAFVRHFLLALKFWQALGVGDYHFGKVYSFKEWGSGYGNAHQDNVPLIVVVIKILQNLHLYFNKDSISTINGWMVVPKSPCPNSWFLWTLHYLVKRVFETVMKLRSLWWDHFGLSRWAVNQWWVSVLVRDR